MALNQAFDADTLHVLRKAVLAEATAAGMPRDRATEVMIAVHELAANTVSHGAGTGRLRMHAAGGQLYCHVSDSGPARAAGDADGRGHAVSSWPVEASHGLWLVRQVADLVSVVNGPSGSEATAVFTMPETKTADDG
jgi:anti-sigma regulatory factor (Ser/Thr protein kinase)